MALIILPNGRYIDIPADGYGIDYGKDNIVIERNIPASRVVELLRYYDPDDPLTYTPGG